MNSHDFEDIYVNLGINLDTLGCVMLKVEPIDISTIIPADWGYTTKHPERFWIKGLKGGDHITLLYGLLPVYASRTDYETAVDTVLDGWKPPQPQMRRVGSFPSPYSDEPYACIVAHLELDGLLDAHQRLSFLPHINTFPDYNAHLTLGYVKKEYEQRTLAKLVTSPFPTIKPISIDYGKLNNA